MVHCIVVQLFPTPPYIQSAIHTFCVEGLLKILDFGYFVLIWWQTDKTRNFEADFQGSVYLDRTVNCLINYRIQ